MARTVPTEQQGNPHPATKFLEWQARGSNAPCFSHWVKGEKKGEGQNEYINNVVIAPLRIGFSITGGKKNSAGQWVRVYSNEAVNNNDHMRVMLGGFPEPIAQGTYSQVKDKARAQGGKYTKCLHVAAFLDMNDLSKTEIWHIKLTGKMNSEMIELQQQLGDKLWVGHALTWQRDIANCNEHENSNGKYYTAKWNVLKLTPEQDDVAGEKQAIVSKYLETYVASTKRGEGNAPLEEAASPNDARDFLQDTGDAFKDESAGNEFGEPDPFAAQQQGQQPAVDPFGNQAQQQPAGDPFASNRPTQAGL